MTSLLSSGLTLSLSACSSDSTRSALDELADVRRKLAQLKAPPPYGLAAEALAIAEQSASQAERAIRRNAARFLPFSTDEAWRADFKRALELAAIATWVVERERDVAKAEAETWLAAATSAVERYSERRAVLSLSLAMRVELRKAELALREASRFHQESDFSLASHKAKQAHDLVAIVQEEVEDTLARFSNPVYLREWQGWVQQATLESRTRGHSTLVVDKRTQVAMLWENGAPTKGFDIELGYNGLRRKIAAGDGATPEGLYRVTKRKQGRETRYYKALLLDYPNQQDRERFRLAKNSGKIPASEHIGGLIEIHGDGGRRKNWTDGCIAVSNADMDYLFEKLAPGSRVAIVGAYEGAPISTEENP